ncbi:MAG: hypothetical protein LAP21_09515 [Acidobacteriia bacterium]|nr:hypothetical protein [Terriglobia bacterium]
MNIKRAWWFGRRAAVLVFALCLAGSGHGNPLRAEDVPGLEQEDQEGILKVENLLGAKGSVTLKVLPEILEPEYQRPRVCIEGAPAAECFEDDDKDDDAYAFQLEPIDVGSGKVLIKVVGDVTVGRRSFPTVAGLLKVDAQGKLENILPAGDRWLEDFADISTFPIVTSSPIVTLSDRRWSKFYTYISYRFCLEQDRYLAVDGFAFGKLKGPGILAGDLKTIQRERLLAQSKVWQHICVADPARMNGVYTGTIGDQEIVFEIGNVEEAPQFHLHNGLRNLNGKQVPDPQVHPLAGRYFYRRHGKVLWLLGRPLEDGSLRIEEYQGQEPTGFQWRLAFDGDHAHGTFCKCDASQPVAEGTHPLAVALMRVTNGFDAEFQYDGQGGDATDQAYYDALAQLPLKTGTEIRAGAGLAYAMDTDPQLNLRMPRLTQFPDADVMKKVNDRLEEEISARRLFAAGCEHGKFGSGAPRFGDQVSVVLTRRRLVVQRSESYNCGGMRVTGKDHRLVFDLRTGSERN